MDLEKYRTIRDKFESNYTILIREMKVEEITKSLHKKLENINQMKDAVKRKYLNDRVFSLVEHFNELEPEDTITGLYLLGKTIECLPLTKHNTDILIAWSIPNFIFKCGEFFDIDYINSLFDTEYCDTIKIMNKRLSHVQLNPNKKRTVLDQDINNDFNLEEYINRIVTKGKCLLYGVSSVTKNFKPNNNTIVIPKVLTDDQIFDEYKKDAMIQIHQQVQDLFNHLGNEKMMHRVLIGKDIQQAIKFSQIQTLFCTPKMAKNVAERVAKDLQTFKVVEVLSIEKGDVGHILEATYNGAIGITYF